MGTVWFELAGRVTVAGVSAVVGDSFIFSEDLPFSNPSGTPRNLAHNATLRQELAYDTSQTAEVAAVSDSFSANTISVQITQTGAPNVGATIVWTLKYLLELN
jgi:hypothetical protein